MAKITKLTEEQAARLPVFRDEYLKHGISTAPSDKPRAEAAFARAYRAIGKEPMPVIWVNSPLSASLAFAALEHLALRENAASTGAAFEPPALGGQLGDQLGGQLGGQLWGQLGDQLGGQLGSEISPWYDAYWLALYTHAVTIAGLEPSARLEALVAATKACGWWWPLQGVAVLTDRPTLISRDQQGRLHHDTGPALTYADGYTLAAWHGVRVPEGFHDWDLTRVLSEKNTEIRRCGIERIGWDKVTDQMTLLAEAPDPGNAPHTIRLYDLPAALRDLYDAPARILIVHNASLDKGGHRRTFGLPVEASQTDPIEAAASLFGVPAAAYAQLAHAS